MNREYRGLFITGTDTGVGKTVITAALAAALRDEGRSIGVWKPVQSGATLGSGETDAEQLLRATGLEDRADIVASYTFEAPLTPALAARQAGVNLTLQGLVEAGQPLAQRYEGLLVEGAGGAAVPLTDTHLVADFMEMLGLPVLIVARSGLGTINHTLLTAGLLRQRGLQVVGVVLNDGCHSRPDGTEEDSSTDSNGRMIERYGGLKVLGHFPRLGNGLDRRELVEAVARSLDMTPVRKALDKSAN